MNLKITIILNIIGIACYAQSPHIFDLQSFSKKENETIHFVSVSDIYTLSEHKDSTAIPSLKGKNEGNAKYLKLESKFKKRFLSKTKIADSDKLFLYDYSKDILLTFPIKSLNTVACLNEYGAAWPFKQEDYRYGFEINDKLAPLNNDYNNVLIAISKENPFAKGEIKNINWKKIAVKNLPTILIKEKKLAEINQFIKTKKPKLGQLFEHKTTEYSCYLQEYNDTKGKNLVAKHVTIVNENTKKIALQKFFIESEGVTFAPLTNQWIGKLFVNSVPVLFGFQNFSLGCPEIFYLDQSEKPIIINCDNRH